MPSLRESLRTWIDPQWTAREAAVSQLSEELRTTRDDLDYAKETIVELELARDNLGWQKIGAQYEKFAFDRDFLDTISRLASVMYIKNPLIKQAVTVDKNYVFNAMPEVTCEDESVLDVIDQFMADWRNRKVLTSLRAMGNREVDRYVMGNVFMVLFTSRQTKRVSIRQIPMNEIRRIICNPEDYAEVWYYERHWAKEKTDASTGETRSEIEKALYPDFAYQPKQKPLTFAGLPINWNSPVYQIKGLTLENMQFGISEIYSSIDWAKAYNKFLEDWATLSRAYSQFASKLSLPKGDKSAIAKAQAQMGTAMANTNGRLPNATGSMFMGGPGVDYSPIRIGGANVEAEDGRRLLLMVCAGVGLPETFFGDVSVGTLATAKSLDRPTELKFKTTQETWADVLRDILMYVVQKSEIADVVDEEDGTPSLSINGEPVTIKITFPSITRDDLLDRVKAIVEADSTKKLSDETIARLLLQAFDVENIDELLQELEGLTNNLDDDPDDLARQSEESDGERLTPAKALLELRESIKMLKTAIEAKAGDESSE